MTPLEGFLTVLGYFAGIGATLAAVALCMAATDSPRPDRSLPGALGSSPWRELDEAEEER